MIKNLLEPIHGIEVLIKDTPSEKLQRQELRMNQSKPCHRNRQHLRHVMSKTKPLSNGDEKDPTNHLEHHVMNHISRINNTTENLKQLEIRDYSSNYHNRLRDLREQIFTYKPTHKSPSPMRGSQQYSAFSPTGAKPFKF